MSIQLPGLPSLDQVATAAAPNVQPYATPAAIKAQRDYAEALMHGAVGKGGAQFPVVQSWTQGASNMLNALMGGLDARSAENREQNTIAHGNQPDVPVPSDPTKPSSFTDGSSSEGREKTSDDDAAPQPKGTKVAANGDTPMDYGVNSRAIAGIESGGSKDPYHLHGPTILNPRSAYFGDQAHGKYQVMGKNVGPWTQEVLGRAETPAEFDDDAAGQEAVFKAKFKNPTQWFGSGKSDGYTTGDAYRARFAAAGGRPVGGSTTAAAFAGPDAQPPAVAAMSTALRGGQSDPNAPQPVADVQVAANKSAPPISFAPGQRPLPNPQRTGIYYDPRLIKPPPQYTPDQMQALQSRFSSDPAVANAILQQYRQQGQPLQLPYPGGTVVVDPRNPSVQQFIPEGHWGNSTNKMGDLEQTSPTFQVPTPNGGLYTAPPVAPPAGATIGPRSEAAPPPPPPAMEAPVARPTAPASAIPAAPAVKPPPAVTTASAAPAMTPVAAPGAGAPVPPAVAAAEAAKPVQVASLDPAAGVAQAAGKSPVVPVNETAVAAPEGPLSKWAQAAPPGAPVSVAGSPGQNEKALDIQSFPPGMVHDYQSMQDYKKNLAVDEDAQKKGTELAMKKYDNLSTQAQNARTLRPNVDLALSMMNDPNFHGGLFKDGQDLWARFKEKAFGDRYANASNETFDKLMAGNVLGTMKTALGGLGQVRLAEIQLLNKANGSRNNTDASNRAVLEISRRGLEKVDQIDGMGQEYQSGGAVHDPITGKELIPDNVDHNGDIQPRRGLDVGFDKIIRKWTNDNPSFKPEEIKNYETIFDTNRPPEQGSAPAAKPEEKTTVSPSGAPKVGDVVKGYSFKGGDPADQNNWEKTK